MKFGKKSTAAVAFVVGMMIFATAALADTAIGSGYQSLKDATKETVARLTDDTDNFQVDFKFCAKADGKEFVRDNQSIKMDVKNHIRETSMEGLDSHGEEFSDYSYGDDEVNIYKRDKTQKYSVYERRKGENAATFMENPFEEDIAKDGEKVLDAFVGSLSEVIQKEEVDGKTMYVGNLTETQVPMLVNALTSFVLKYGILTNMNSVKNMPKIESDVCLKSASGKAVQDETGLLTDVMGNVTLVGSDKNGNEHEITAEISVSLFGIGTTVIEKPILTEENSDWYPAGRGTEDLHISQKHVGVYKNNIVEAEGDSLRKVGERVLEITEAGDGVCNGVYYEIYYNGYEPKNAIEAFTFTKQKMPEGVYASGDCVLCRLENGETKNMILRLYNGSNSAKIDVCYGVEFDENGYSSVVPENFDEVFVRVFD